MNTDDNHEAIAKKESSPYGPWLLVTYGRQGSRNIKGRTGKVGNGNGYGSSGYVEKKGFSNTTNKNKVGDFDTRLGNSIPVKEIKNGAKNTAAVKSSGSRFDVLNDEVNVRNVEKR